MIVRGFSVILIENSEHTFKLFISEKAKTQSLTMNTLITYCSTHGFTEKVASEIKSFIGENVTLCNLKKEPSPDIRSFDRIIIGGSIHAGQIQKKVRQFCKSNHEALLKTEIGLFICCMEEGEKAYEELEHVYPKDLIQHAKVTACLGGEFNFEKMNFLEKFIVRKAAKVNKSTSKRDYEAIRNFSTRMNKIFNPFLFFV